MAKKAEGNQNSAGLLRTCMDCYCDVPTNQKRCPNCGSSRVKAESVAHPDRPSDSWQCSYRAGGLRCQYPGSVSNDSASNGVAADWKPRWYCRAHVDCHDPVIGAQIVEASFARQSAAPADVAEVQAKAKAYCASLGLDTPDKVRAHAAKLAFKVLRTDPSKDWARKIVQREEDGEAISSYVSALARTVLEQAK